MNKLQIEGLTEEQCNMLDAMWDKETAEDLFEFFQGLSQEQFDMAMTLHTMLMQEIGEEKVEMNTNLAVEMLENIGVNLGK